VCAYAYEIFFADGAKQKNVGLCVMTGKQEGVGLCVMTGKQEDVGLCVMSRG
jgi:hypothetical protein